MADTRIQCQFTDCAFVAEHQSEAVAIAMLNSHVVIHSARAEKPSKQRVPTIDRPNIKQDITCEDWLTFVAEWGRFKRCTEIDHDDVADQLFQCCEHPLRRLLLKENPEIIDLGEESLLVAIKKMAVIQVATSVRRTSLLASKQDHGQTFGEFYANVRATAATCEFRVKCPLDCCKEKKPIDYTSLVVRDIMIAGIADTEIYKDVLSIPDLESKSDREILRFVEEKEIARDACYSASSNTAGISSYKRPPHRPQSRNAEQARSTEITKKLAVTGHCQICGAVMNLYKQFKNRSLNAKPFKLCASCFRSSRKTSNNGKQQQAEIPSASESDAINAFMSAVEQSVGHKPSDIISLDHYIFTPKGWEKAKTLKHPSFKATVHANPDDYVRFRKMCPSIRPSVIDVIADSGAQSCLWSLEEYLLCGFRMDDLIPVRLKLNAANRAPISVCGAAFLRIKGFSRNGHPVEAAAMVYISKEANSFFASQEVLKQLGIIPASFPRIGDTFGRQEFSHIQSIYSTNSNEFADCGCLRRTSPPGKPDALPFPCTADNVPKMKRWLLERYASSTFNRCPHQELPEMTGPPIEFHVDSDAKPVNLKKPASVPLHWQEKVLEDLNRDVNLGVLERVPHGEPTKWCFRMVIGRKCDGSPRRTVDLSPLNKFCKREAHSSRSPFHVAKSIPPDSTKTVLDAWNGFHSVPIRDEDKHYTTFTTPWGLFRYKRAPQGFLSSGDGYVRRFDDLTAHFQRLERCVDDSLLYDASAKLDDHWWRVIEFLETAGQGGVVLNPEKFQFSQTSVDFAGFRITGECVEPLPKYMDAIRDYPTPQNITDIRSWFGLVNQVSHYAQLREMMEPFRKFLSPKVKFQWTTELDDLFVESKLRIVDAVRQGVKIYDPSKRTALRTDWSRAGIGFWLLQKQCTCVASSHGCCLDGWHIVLAGSRFLSQAESNYAAIEGEALAVAWALEQTRYFTMGCDNLLVIVDHKPLVKILGDRRLDEIDNPRLFRLKQRTLMWRYDIQYQPGKSNHFADATSRHPSYRNDIGQPCMEDPTEEMMVAGLGSDVEKFFAVTVDRVRAATKKDMVLSTVVHMILNGFPASIRDMPEAAREYWPFREYLSWVSDLVVYKDRIVIPVSLRQRVLDNLHSAHQGVSSMMSRAQACIFWPGFSTELSKKREGCRVCNRNAPSNAKLPPVYPKLPETPFEMIYADYFTLCGKHFLVVGDRLSGWTEVTFVEVGSATAGSKGLCTALRRIFSSFGVPEEISSDGGPEFVGQEFKQFLKQWGVTHRLSSAYFPQSNGRAEVAVKTTKRLLEDNVDMFGTLDSDNVVRALLQHRNTPDRISKLSPAEILFGRTLRDTIPQLDKSLMIFENPKIDDYWRHRWRLKENAIRSHLVDSSARLEEHSKELTPLFEGDNVFIQNQGTNPRHPKKWDRVGTVIACGKNDQYLIRVRGSRRLTIRNRRFLRFMNRDDFQRHDSLRQLPVSDKLSRDSPASATSTPILSKPDKDFGGKPDRREEDLVPRYEKEPDEEERARLYDIFNESSDDEDFAGFPVQSDDNVSGTYPTNTDNNVDNISVHRSPRSRKKRLLYDAATGKYK